MSMMVPSFPWIGGFLVHAGGMTVTQVEILNDRVNGIDEKVDKLVHEVHAGHVAVEKLAVLFELVKRSHEDNKIILQELYEDKKFWKKIRNIMWGVIAFAAAYAIGWMDFFKNFFK